MLFYLLILIIYSSFLLNIIKYIFKDSNSIVHRQWLYIKEISINNWINKNIINDPRYFDYYYFKDYLK